MKVVKTIKLFINGQFVRTESGRSYVSHNARLCQASKKDVRNAVEVAKKAVGMWSSRSSYNRSQILYRMAEMCESKRYEFEALFVETLGLTQEQAAKEVTAGIDTFVYYAGFCDKYQQMIGAVNPVNGPFHNFTTPSPVGVTILIENQKFSFAHLIDHICSILVPGNAVIALLGDHCPAVLAPLSEVLATSDLPPGVVNLLTGDIKELHEVMALHREVRSISFQRDQEDIFFKMKELGTDNMKRMIPPQKALKSLDNILKFVEYKTVWHPIGQ